MREGETKAMTRLLTGLLVTFLFFGFPRFGSGQEPAQYTGLVVDATGLGLSPGMAPKIFDESDRLVYGDLEVTPEEVNQIGIAGYVQTMADVEGSRGGSRPLVVRATRIHGAPDAPFPTDVVIAKKDADHVLDQESRGGFLKKMKVVFVMGLPSPLSPSSLPPKPRPPEAPPLPPLFLTLGIDKADWGIMVQDQGFVSKVERLPSGARTLYKSLSYFEKLRYNKDLHGTTTVLFYTIDNRKAFVEGKVMGNDVFLHRLAESIEDFKSGKITREEYEKRKKALELLSRLTPEDRDTLVTLLERELKAREIRSTARASS